MQRFVFCCAFAILAGSAASRKLPAQDTTSAKPADTTAAKPADTTATVSADTTAAVSADTTAAVPADTATTAQISLKDVAGKWVIRTVNDSGDITLATYNMVATPDTSGWTLSQGKRKPVPVRVLAVAGDSIVTEAGPYEGALRKGVKVTLHNVTRLRDGKLVGVTIARYATSGPDSLLQGQFEGTRAP
jgi:hypothetical protein